MVSLLSQSHLENKALAVVIDKHNTGRFTVKQQVFDQLHSPGQDLSDLIYPNEGSTLVPVPNSTAYFLTRWNGRLFFTVYENDDPNLQDRVYEIIDETHISAVQFLRGDANTDTIVNLADAIFILSFTFSGGKEANCMKSADANDDGKVDLADAIWVLAYQFNNGQDPKAPFPNCGIDTTPENDDLSCYSFKP